MAQMRAEHPVFGVKDVKDSQFNRDNGWTPVDPSTPTTEQVNRRALNDVLRDPSSRKAGEVAAAIEVAPEGVAESIRVAEKSGKNRKTALDAE